ncbi:MAG: hypothetical protein O2V44_04485 [Candidatus Bathyarchaeota archaeon]|nr:hypothetical protein [Candidatus Bathyarchaeota archaeon]
MATPYPGNQNSAGPNVQLRGTARVQGLAGVDECEFILAVYPEEGWYPGEGPAIGFRLFEASSAVTYYYVYGELVWGSNQVTL